MNTAATISLPVGKGIFNYRVAGVAIRDGHVLLHKTPTDRFWSLPGGRVDLFEQSKDALIREMLEETGQSVQVGQLLWLAENFFQYNGADYHEIGLYYEIHYPASDERKEFIVREGEQDLLFQWHPLSALHIERIYPKFITEDLLKNPGTFRHFAVPHQDLHSC